MLECGIQWKNNSMETEIQSHESGHYKIKSDGQDGDDWQGDIWAKTWNQWGWGPPLHPEDEHPGGSGGAQVEGGRVARVLRKQNKSLWLVQNRWGGGLC